MSVGRDGEIDHRLLSFEAPCSVAASLNTHGIPTAPETIVRADGKRSVAPINGVVRKSRSCSMLFERKYFL